MPTLKEILTKQAAVPAGIEAKLPAAAPKLSQMMIDIAGSFPIDPVLPEIPLVPQGAVPVQIITIIEGIPEVPTIPTVPLVTATASRFRPTPASAGVTSAQVRARVLEGGYRSF